jgi:hypothetical protein
MSIIVISGFNGAYVSTTEILDEGANGINTLVVQLQIQHKQPFKIDLILINKVLLY